MLQISFAQDDAVLRDIMLSWLFNEDQTWKIRKARKKLEQLNERSRSSKRHLPLKKTNLLVYNSKYLHFVKNTLTATEQKCSGECCFCTNALDLSLS